MSHPARRLVGARGADDVQSFAHSGAGIEEPVDVFVVSLSVFDAAALLVVGNPTASSARKLFPRKAPSVRRLDLGATRTKALEESKVLLLVRRPANVQLASKAVTLGQRN